ncbi:MAG: hypothetical protein ACREN8_10215 [Candidatus Dormibacteraceae bacterium]
MNYQNLVKHPAVDIARLWCWSIGLRIRCRAGLPVSVPEEIAFFRSKADVYRRIGLNNPATLELADEAEAYVAELSSKLDRPSGEEER